MVGSATLTIVPSRTAMTMPRATVRKARRRRGLGRPSWRSAAAGLATATVIQKCFVWNRDRMRCGDAVGYASPLVLARPGAGAPQNVSALRQNFERTKLKIAPTTIGTNI